MNQTITRENLRKSLISIFYSSCIQVQKGYSFQKDNGNGLGITYKLEENENLYETMLPISNIGNKDILIDFSRGDKIFDDIEIACENTVDKILDYIFKNKVGNE